MSRASGAFAITLFGLVAFSAGGCSSGNQDPTGSGGAPTGGLPGAGGIATAGGVTSQGGASQGGQTVQVGGATAQGGATSTPAGQLMCGGVLCHAGGHCAADGSCPAFLGECFMAGSYQTCDAYCTAQHFTCAMKSCNPDGTPSASGLTSVGYTGAHAMDCQMAAYPDTNNFDDCRTPINLASTAPTGDLIRCCCKG
jgi:hypothetical protein